MISDGTVIIGFLLFGVALSSFLGVKYQLGAHSLLSTRSNIEVTLPTPTLISED